MRIWLGIFSKFCACVWGILYGLRWVARDMAYWPQNHDQMPKCWCKFAIYKFIVFIRTRRNNSDYWYQANECSGFFLLLLLISGMQGFKDWSLFDASIWVSFFLSKLLLFWSFSLLFLFQVYVLVLSFASWILALYLIISFTFYSLNKSYLDDYVHLLPGFYCWDYKSWVTGKIVHFQTLEPQMLLLCTWCVLLGMISEYGVAEEIRLRIQWLSGSSHAPSY